MQFGNTQPVAMHAPCTSPPHVELHDQAHAILVDAIVRWLRNSLGVCAYCEVPFNHFGDRGFIDVVAINRPSPEQGWRAIACEVKPFVQDLGGTIRQVRKAQAYFRLPKDVLDVPHSSVQFSFPLVLEATETNYVQATHFSHVLDGVDVHFFSLDRAFDNPFEHAWKASRDRNTINAAIRTARTATQTATS